MMANGARKPRRAMWSSSDTRMIWWCASNTGRKPSGSGKSFGEWPSSVWNLHADKTRLIEFGRFAVRGRKQRGEREARDLYVLGFYHCCGQLTTGALIVTPVLRVCRRFSAKWDALLMYSARAGRLIFSVRQGYCGNVTSFCVKSPRTSTVPSRDLLPRVTL